VCLLTENCTIQQTHIIMDDTRFLQYSNTEIINSKIMTIKYYKTTITDFPQKDEIICDADLHNKFRNNPHEKNASLFL